jgi:DNA-binding NarL/FixJ family response regulator
MKKVSILIVDDHQLIRDSWSFILSSDSRFEVVGALSNAEEAVAFVQKNNPDIVLMDVNMSPVNGFEATKQIKKASTHSKVIGVTMHSMPAYAKKMMQSGAMGYITKNSPKDEMITAILEVHEGRNYLCADVKNIMLQKNIGEPDGKPDINVLSRRELDIARLIRDGLSSKEIALKLDISLKTVEVHRYNLLKKLNLPNAAALVNFINQTGI